MRRRLSLPAKSIIICVNLLLIIVYRLTSDKYSDNMIYNIIFVRNGAIWLDNERGSRYFGYNFKR